MISARAEIGAGGNVNRRQSNNQRYERQTPDAPTAPRPPKKYPNDRKRKGSRKTTTESATSPAGKRPARSKAPPAADKAPTAPSGPSAKRRKNIRTAENKRKGGKQRQKTHLADREAAGKVKGAPLPQTKALRTTGAFHEKAGKKPGFRAGISSVLQIRSPAIAKNAPPSSLFCTLCFTSIVNGRGVCCPLCLSFALFVLRPFI